MFELTQLENFFNLIPLPQEKEDHLSEEDKYLYSSSLFNCEYYEMGEDSADIDEFNWPPPPPPSSPVDINNNIFINPEKHHEFPFEKASPPPQYIPTRYDNVFDKVSHIYINPSALSFPIPGPTDEVNKSKRKRKKRRKRMNNDDNICIGKRKYKKRETKKIVINCEICHNNITCERIRKSMTQILKHNSNRETLHISKINRSKLKDAADASENRLLLCKNNANGQHGICYHCVHALKFIQTPRKDKHDFPCPTCSNGINVPLPVTELLTTTDFFYGLPVEASIEAVEKFYA